MVIFVQSDKINIEKAKLAVRQGRKATGLKDSRAA